MFSWRIKMQLKLLGMLLDYDWSSLCKIADLRTRLGLILVNGFPKYVTGSKGARERSSKFPIHSYDLENRQIFPYLFIKLVNNSSRQNKKKKSQTWRRFGYPVFISIDFDDFTLPFTLSFLFRLKRYIKHSRQCLIGFPNTSIEFRQKHSAARRIFNFLPAPKTIPAWAPDNTTFSKRNTNFLSIFNILFSSYFYLLIYANFPLYLNFFRLCSSRFYPLKTAVQSVESS